MAVKIVLRLQGFGMSDPASAERVPPELAELFRGTARIRAKPRHELILKGLRSAA